MSLNETEAFNTIEYEQATVAATEKATTAPSEHTFATPTVMTALQTKMDDSIVTVASVGTPPSPPMTLRSSPNQTISNTAAAFMSNFVDQTNLGTDVFSNMQHHHHQQQLNSADGLGTPNGFEPALTPNVSHSNNQTPVASFNQMLSVASPFINSAGLNPSSMQQHHQHFSEALMSTPIMSNTMISTSDAEVEAQYNSALAASMVGMPSSDQSSLYFSMMNASDQMGGESLDFASNVMYGSGQDHPGPMTAPSSRCPTPVPQPDTMQNYYSLPTQQVGTPNMMPMYLNSPSFSNMTPATIPSNFSNNNGGNNMRHSSSLNNVSSPLTPQQSRQSSAASMISSNSPAPSKLNISDLTEPIKITGSGANTIFHCNHPGCNKTFTKRTLLKSHMVSHSTDRSHTCPDCGNLFRRAHDLYRHIRTVLAREKPFGPCVGCGRRFTRTEALRRHKNCRVGGAGGDEKEKKSSKKSGGGSMAAMKSRLQDWNLQAGSPMLAATASPQMSELSAMDAMHVAQMASYAYQNSYPHY